VGARRQREGTRHGQADLLRHCLRLEGPGFGRVTGDRSMRIRRTDRQDGGGEHLVAGRPQLRWDVPQLGSAGVDEQHQALARIIREPCGGGPRHGRERAPVEPAPVKYLFGELAESRGLAGVAGPGGAH